MKKQLLVPAVLALALGTGAATLQTNGAFAQAQTQQQSGQDQSQRPHRDFAARLDHRIDRMKTDLKITPAQQAQFDRLAQVLRDNAAERQKVFEDVRASRDQQHNAIDRLEFNAKMTQLRSTQEQRYLDAFRPLYASFSPDQKQIADKMYTSHRGHGRGHI